MSILALMLRYMSCQPIEILKMLVNLHLKLENNGYSILVGSAGMSAHLAGALKAHSTLPVVGIPHYSGMMDGLDSLMSTVNMPKIIPVATVSMGKAGAINAAVLCAEIFSLNDDEMVKKLTDFKNNGCML